MCNAISQTQFNNQTSGSVLLALKYTVCSLISTLHIFRLKLQAEANKLKDIIVSGRRTKMVSLGIGSGVSQIELENIASAPKDKNVIRVQSFSSLTDVEDQLRNTSCTGL